MKPDVSQMSDADLSDLIADGIVEQMTRAAAAGDLEAVTEETFGRAFDQKGHAANPALRDGLLICAGSLVGSDQSHQCTFVRSDDRWVWEHPDVLADTVRLLTAGRVNQQRSVSILPAFEGMTFDVVTSRCRSGKHTMVEAHSFVVQRGETVPVSTRRGSPVGHRS